jgi:hypothetical protein
MLSGNWLSIRIPILLKLFLHRLVLHGNMNKLSFLLVLCECISKFVVSSFRLVFMYTRISYIYRLDRGNICNDLKYCLQLMFFGICTIALIALFCSLNINLTFAKFPQNISPYNSKEWKYAQYKVRTVSNPDTRLITLTAKHILLNLVTSCWVCIDHFIFLSSQSPKNFICSV